MRYILSFFVFSVMVVILFLGCTPNANTYYNRQMQPIVTKYNVLFNGEEAFDIGRKELQEKYEDNYDEILPVEPIRMSGEVQLDGMGNPNFERAEEKAIKTIQRHSMVYDGVQRNYKIDDAYLLLGEARYYNERFIPALEAFNHMLTNYGKSERINEAAVWAQKTNLRLHKDKIAIANLQQILDNTRLRKKDRAEAYATLGQAYINQEEYNEAADALYKAAKYTPNKNLRGRYYFIAAQLYEQQRMKDSAAVAFEKVIKLNWKISRRLWVEAQAGKVRNTEFTPEEKAEYIAYLTKLENRYEHKDYLDALYYLHGTLIRDEQPSPAIQYYKNSLRNNVQNDRLKGKAHERLAELYFEKRDYVGAYHHFDSTLVYVPEHTFERLFLERKKENLAKITELEYTVRENDSVLRISNMSAGQQRAYFQQHIDSLNRVAERASVSPTDTFQGSGVTLQNQPDTGGRFYFYNPITVAYGKQQFRQLWGGRKLEDNWRWASVGSQLLTDNISDGQPLDDAADEGLTPEFYLNQLPANDAEIAALRTQRNQALYQLGVLYRTKFNDHDTANERLSKLIASQPDAQLEPAALYEWHRNLQVTLPEKAEQVKNQLITAYPNSDYAHLIRGGETSQNIRNQKANLLFAELENDFVQGKIVEASQRIEEESTLYKQTSAAPKIELLKAQINGRLYGVNTYLQALENLSVTYPDTDESTQAKALIEELQKSQEEGFVPDEKTRSWKIVIYDIPTEVKEDLTDKIRAELADISDRLVLTNDIYNAEEQWLVIHGLQNRNTANIIRQDLKKIFTAYNVADSNMPIATENYRVLLIQKSKKAYLEYIR
ncbi:MAG: tetratricopeptide repeat protein [Capnocytophaga sp.]|nr:tetratricopeptide repeat protein [Capnocytophaga sp.]